MRRSILFLWNIVMLFCASLTYSSCDLFGDSSDVEYKVKWLVDFRVTTSAANPDPLGYSIYNYFDASTDPYVIRYRDKIKRYRLDKITYEVYYYSAPGGVPSTNGTLNLLSSGKTVASVNSLNFQRTFGEIEFINTNTEGFKDINQRLNENNRIDVTCEGKLPSSDVTSVIVFRFYVTVVSKAL